MTQRMVSLAFTSVFASSIVLSTVSCATNAPSIPHKGQELSGSALRSRVVQLHFGIEATFGACAEPACPSVTPKTLASEQRVAHLPQLPATASEPQKLATVEASAVTVALDKKSAPNEPTEIFIEAVSGKKPPSSEAPATAASSAAVPPQLPVQGFSSKATGGLPHAFVTFGFGSSQLTEPSKDVLLRSLGNARISERIVISGRTDNVGDAKANEALAFARAMAVREFLRDQLPDLPNIISIDAKGRCCFIASNETSDGRAKNRRVEIAFIAKGGA